VSALGDGFQSTYIDDLDVQLEGVDDRADKTIATLTFRGVSKTSRFDQGEVSAKAGTWNAPRAKTSLGWSPVSAKTVNPRTLHKTPGLSGVFAFARAATRV
jgi:predicted lipid-binding transport protein (Tim44 family)